MDKIHLPIIPLDLRTNKPRQGKWVNNGRHWIFDIPIDYEPTPQSNPNFDTKAGKRWLR